MGGVVSFFLGELEILLFSLPSADGAPESVAGLSLLDFLGEDAALGLPPLAFFTSAILSISGPTASGCANASTRFRSRPPGERALGEDDNTLGELHDLGESRDERGASRGDGASLIILVAVVGDRALLPRASSDIV